MAESVPAGKICIVCKQDCSRKPRTKDAHGRYICGPCESAAVARRKSPQTGVGEAPRTAAPAVEEDEPFELEGFDPAAMQDLLKVEAGAAPVGPPPTLTFEEPTSADVAEQGRKCPKCGYNLRGLKGRTCPECGAEARYKSGRTHAMESIEEERRTTVRMAYIRPISLAVGGVIALAVIRGAQGRGEDLPGELVLLGIRVPVGIVAYLICCATFLGFNAPVHLTALRLAGVYAVMAALWALVSGFPIGLFRLALLAVYIILLMTELELDRGDAIIMALLTGGVSIGITILIVVMFPGLF
ncbi:MAG: hypothetical protein GIKADHBN_01891 [Phycisphaerales bacterium]|nr:hypothetical protein [Phycisphaerales bacterium]MCK6476803.1 hypothetical protein [Phycisphaerales bacterium]